MTPHEVKLPSKKDSLGHWFLFLLQILAMALCACLIARFIMEDAFKLPREMCTEGYSTVEP
jgi:hypothetical protein